MSPSPDENDYAAMTRENEGRLLRAESDGSVRVDAVPLKITFEFTGDCNLHCFFCDCEFSRNELRKQGMHRFSMDESTFRMMAEVAFPKATVINPTVVGEPFTFPHFDLMVEYAEKYAVRLELVTNGMLLKNPRLDRVLPLLDRLIMSFDGGSKEVFEHCRTGSKFDVVISNLRQFKKRRDALGLRRQVKFDFGVTLMRENIEEFPRIVEWAHELDVDTVHAGHLLVFTKDLRGSSLLEHKALANMWIEKAIARANELGVRLNTPALFDLDADEAPPAAIEEPEETTGLVPRQEILRRDDGELSRDEAQEILATEAPPPDWAEDAYWCPFAWRQVFVTVEGNVAPCCHQGRPIVGNVFKDEWDDIWNGEEYQALRRGLREKKPQSYCASCALLAEQGHVAYDEKGYIFEDRYPDQSRADQRPR